MKKNLIWIFTAVLGILTFCFFNFPYISTHISQQSASYDGFSVLGMWADGFSGGMMAFLQLVIWLLTFLLTMLATCKIISLTIGRSCEDFCGISVKGLSELLMLAHAILQFFFMIFAITHTVRLSDGDFKYAVNVGAILNFVLSVGLNAYYFTLKLLKKI